MTDPDPLEVSAARLREDTRKSRGPSVKIFKGFRKEEENRLKDLFKSGASGREITRKRSAIVDTLFRELFGKVLSDVAPKGVPESLAVSAFGGYGRRELTPNSDIDIIFLHGKETPSKETEEVVRLTLMALWDIGFKVGHATRSVAQAIKQSNADLVTKTAMLEARFLTGDKDVFNEFKRRFELQCIRGHKDEYFAWRMASQEEVYAKFGNTALVQEPNVKNGVGGLRDVQNLLWIAYFQDGLSSLNKLVEKKILRDAERRTLDRGYDFLLRVRTQMQYLGSKASDTLTLQMQGKVANAFNYPQRHILRRVEEFMRDYYTHTREIHLITSAAIDRLGIRKEPSGSKLFGLIQPKIEHFDGFVAKAGKLYAESKSVLIKDEYRIMRAFHHIQVRQLELSSELRDQIRRRVPSINRTYQYARAARETFLSILSRKGEVGRILREMHDLGVLGRYIPEFGELTCLVQHEFFHRYTADEHTLVCIEKLDSILFNDERKFTGYRSLLQKLEDPGILYLAILLHDTGKALNSRNHEDQSAVLAQAVARRLQLTPERRRMLITLVNAHYELSWTAQKRNLDDPATISHFAQIVGNRPNIDALMLLTLADGMGTSDENWSDWKEGLVWTLYRRTAAYLERGESALGFFRRSVGELRDGVASQLPTDFTEEIAAHFGYMPDRYFQMFGADVIANHLELFRRFFQQHLSTEKGGLSTAFQWVDHPDKGHTEVWVCGWDRAGLLERIAGAFLSCNINVLSADIFTRGDNLALDIFRVCTQRLEPVTDRQDKQMVEDRLTQSLAVEEFNFRPLLKKEQRLYSYKISYDADLPSKIVIGGTSHPSYTLVDIQTSDRLGLLYDLLRAFDKAGINIELSRITTEMDVALDTFYVTNSEGQRLQTKKEVNQLKKYLLKACENE